MSRTIEGLKLFAAVGTAALLTACGSTEIIDVPQEPVPAEPASELHPLSLEGDRLAGDVALRDDGTSLVVTVNAHPGLRLTQVRVCLGTSAFRWLAPESCSFAATAPDKGAAKLTVAIELADLGESVEGDVLYVQAAASILEEGRQTGWAYAGTFKGRVGYTVAGAVQDAASGVCALSAGDWAGEKHEWPTAALPLGDTVYGKHELLDLLARPAAGDASVLLAKQVIAVRLNEAAGAVLPAGVESALDAVDAWFGANADADGTLPFEIAATPGYEPNTAAFDEGVNTSEMLRQFNAGKLTAPACE